LKGPIFSLGSLIGAIKNSFGDSTKMKATRSMLAAIALVSAVAATQADAQCSGNAGSCNTTNTASVTVGTLVKLGMSSATTSLTNPTADQIDAGTALDNAGPTFSVKSNRSWTLKIKAQPAVAGFWDYAGTNSGQKPIGDLAWATSAGGTYTAITASDATFASNASASNGAAAQAFFRTTWSNDFTNAGNAPGTYSLPIVFTLTAP
jgi:hypothetical protein